MNVDTASFFTLTVLSLCLFYSHRSLVWRHAVLLGTSGAFIASFFSSPIDALPIFAYVTVIFFSIYLMAWKRSLAVLWMAIALLVALFFIFKNYIPIGIGQQSLWVTVGISYMMFRAIHVLVDLHDGSLERELLHPLDIGLYLTSIFTFASGPIQRYEEFHEQLHALPQRRIQALDLSSLCGRIVKGLTKVVIVAPLLLGIHDHFHYKAQESVIHLTISAVSFLAYVYLNFSGSMDILIALGSCYGFHLPENFDRPYLARNFLDLWNRWHITLSTHFKTYVFFPFIRAFHLLPGIGQYPVLAGVVGFFVVFLLLGIWHGNSASFVFYGALLGTAAAINKGWEQWRVRRDPPTFLNSWPPLRHILQLAASAAALAYLALAVVAAWPSIHSFSDLMAIYAHVGHIILSFLLLTALLLMTRGIIEFLVSRYPLRAPQPWLYPIAVSLGLVIVLWIKATGQEDFSALNFYQRF